jgi:pantetheine-phosphate adenylyltransferase
MIKIAYPGTFNPWHNGHQYVYSQLCEMFGKDNVYVMVAENREKGTTHEEACQRGLIINCAIRNVDNIIITPDTVAKTCERHAITHVARGIRSGHDATSEFTMADWNLEFGVSTIFIYCGAGLKKMSSSAIRELHSFGFDVKKYMPEHSHKMWLTTLK